jgi:hypothetical protein
MLEAEPKKRITSKQCLQHPFLLIENSFQVSEKARENLRNYEVDFVYNVRNKVQDSQDQFGSYQLF